MDSTLRSKIVSLLDRHRLMTIATLRPDGWPQATTVGYANEGLDIYFLCGRESQKAANIARDDRVSLTIDGDATSLMTIEGLSMAAHAHVVEAHDAGLRILDLVWQRYPEYSAMPGPRPTPEQLCLVRLEPVVISVLDYTKGFGHTDLVTCHPQEPSIVLEGAEWRRHGEAAPSVGA
ncbi:MAG: pyridoxamine 5'-phosphate oxidase family protein [Sphingomonas sp.]